MRESNRTNLPAIALFAQSLTEYENSIDITANDPVLYVTPARNLEMALNRLITANVPDTFQMLRYLASRIIWGKAGPYSEAAILTIASGSFWSVNKDGIMAIVYTLIQIMKGDTPTLDYVWASRVNHNDTIKAFFETYATSDQMKLCGCFTGNVVTTDPSRGMLYNSDSRTSIYLGRYDAEMTLNGTVKQIVQFNTDSPIVRGPNYRPDLPTTILTSVTVKPDMGEFSIDKTIKYTDGAFAVMDGLGCLSKPFLMGTNLELKLPGPFFVAKLDILSLDSGATWVISNIQIIPPSLLS